MHGDPDAVSWIRFRVWTADWYVETLQTLVEELRTPDRWVGVEMCLDGSLSALSGAFDSAVALLTQAVERDEPQKTPAHRYNWNDRLTKLLQRRAPESGDLIDRVQSALEGSDDPIPAGWLARLRRYRNTATHQRSLSRLWGLDNEVAAVTLGKPVTGADADLIDMLPEWCDAVSDLTEHMIETAVRLDWEGYCPRLVRGRMA